MAKININFDEKVYSIDKAVLAPATDALKAHLETLGGGESGGSGLDYGKTVTFKEYLSVEDLVAFTQSLGLSNPTDLYTVMAADTNVGLIQFLGITISSNGLYLQLHYQLLQPKEDGSGSTVVEHLVYEINEDSSHYAWENGLAGEILNEPPTITIFSPHPAQQYEISQFEPLFDLSSIEGNEGNLDITLDGAVYKVDSTKLAPATNSLIAHIETLKGGDEGGSGLAEGEEYKLRSDITAEALIKLEKELAYSQADGMYIVFISGGDMLCEIPAGQMGNTLPMLFVASSDIVYLYALEDVDGGFVKGWNLMEGGQPEGAPSLTIPSPFESFNNQYSLDELAVFFDIPSAGGSGVIDYDKEAKLKKVITVEDFDAFLSKAEGNMVYFGAYTGEPSADNSLVQVMAYNGQYLLNIGNGVHEGGLWQYYLNSPKQEDGWYKNVDDVLTPVTEPPSITIPTGATINPDFETLSIFFDLGGGSTGNEITEVITADSEFSLSWESIFGAPINLYPVYCDIGDIDLSVVDWGAKVHIDRHYKIVVTASNGDTGEMYLDDDGNNELGMSTYVSPSDLPVIMVAKSDGTAAGILVIPNNITDMALHLGIDQATWEMFKAAFPPNSMLVYEDWAGNADMASIAITYGSGSGSGNKGDTKIVINGVEYLVDSAKLADAKRALAEHLKALEDASN